MINKSQQEKIHKQALKEITEEYFREAVNKEKQRLLTKKSFWDKIFPYKILIIKKGE